MNFNVKIALFSLLAGVLLVGGQTVVAVSDENSAPSSKSDIEFMNDVIQNATMEINAAQIAAYRSQNDEVKKFAGGMIDDYSGADTQLMEMAKEYELPVTNMLDDVNKKELDDLDALKGKDFDKAYLDHEINSQDNEIGRLRADMDNVQNAQLKSFAGQFIPKLQGYYQMALKVKDDLGNDLQEPSSPEQGPREQSNSESSAQAEGALD